MKYLLIPKPGDDEIIQNEIELLSKMGKEELVNKYNRYVEIGIVGVRGQSLLIYALAKVFMQVFGKSPINLEQNMILSLGEKIYLNGEIYENTGVGEIEKKKDPKLTHQEMLSKLTKLGYENLSDAEKVYWNSVY